MAEVFHNVFQRIEKKYPLSAEKYELLLKRLPQYMQVDQYGLATLCNIYYDTPDSLLIARSIQRPKPSQYKEKLRVRSYGIPKPDSTVFVEIKKKYYGVVYKRRVSMTLTEQEDYLLRGIRPVGPNEQILNEIDNFIQFYHIVPMLYLAYDRTAWYSPEDSGFRVTFDSNIRYRRDNLSLGAGDSETTKLHMCCDYLMEIKAGGAMPLWMVHLLSELEIFPHSFSKYGNIYKDEHHVLHQYMHDV